MKVATPPPEQIWLLRWKIMRGRKRVRQGQFVTKSEKRAMVRKNMRERDDHYFDVELYTTQCDWRFIE